MEDRRRRHYTDAEKSLMWDRWQRGESLNEIGRAFGIQGYSSIQRIFAETGGIRPRPRHRNVRCLSLAEREETSKSIASGLSLRAIATHLGRAPSAISREIQRNDEFRRYRASHADAAAWRRAKRPKICKLKQHPALAREAAEKITQLWAPRQVAGWLKRQYPEDECRQVSHETIYKSL